MIPPFLWGVLSKKKNHPCNLPARSTAPSHEVITQHGVLSNAVVTARCLYIVLSPPRNYYLYFYPYRLT